jgi:endoglucanase
MKKINLLVFLLAGAGLHVHAQITHIHVDQFGYQKNAQKVAVLVDPQVGFNASQTYTPSSTLEVKRSGTNATVFSGSPTVWNTGQTELASGDRGWWFDFSSLTDTGTFYIRDAGNNMNSHPFRIAVEPYREILQAATKMFYYNRCNMAKSATYAGVKWADDMNFMNPLQDANCRYISDPQNASLEKILTGGWFDSGDYDKQVTHAFPAVHNLLSAYQSHPSLFTDNWNIPESGNGVPDILDEVKWELDWLMKMTNANGSVHIKMGNQNYSDNTDSPPSANTDQRFYGPTCSSASIAAASMLAHGALVLKNFPALQAYAAQLQARAEICYNYGMTFYVNSNWEMGCDDNSIVGGDTDWDIDQQMQGLLTASAYLFAATGTSSYQIFLINNGYLVNPLEDNYWSPYDGPLCDALLYFSTLSNANSGLKGSIQNSASTAAFNNWGDYFGMTNLGLYRDNMPDWSYHGGSNGVKASYGVSNIAIANLGIGDSVNLRRKAESFLHNLHGVNPIGKAFLTNMYSWGAENPVNQMYHLWFADGTDYDHALTSPKGPPPGFLVGGPNKWVSVPSLTPPYGQPNAKSYLDYNDPWPNNSWEVSEPHIQFQAAYVRLLSEIIGEENAVLNLKEIENLELMIYPNPTINKIHVRGNKSVEKAIVYALIGEEVIRLEPNSTSFEIDFSALSEGVYLIQFRSGDHVWTEKVQKR